MLFFLMCGPHAAKHRVWTKWYLVGVSMKSVRVLVGTVALASCSFQPGPFSPGTVGDDALVDTQNEDAGLDAFVLGPWATPTALSLEGDGFDDDPTLTGDMLEMYF